MEGECGVITKRCGAVYGGLGSAGESAGSVVPVLASPAWRRETAQRRTTYPGHQDLKQKVGGYKQERNTSVYRA